MMTLLEGLLSGVLLVSTFLAWRIRGKLLKLLDRLNRAQTEAHIGNWEWEVTTNALWWSDEIYRIFGLPVGEEAPTYERFLGFVYSQDIQKVQDAVSYALAHKTHYVVIHRIVPVDGEIRWVRESGNALYDKQDKPLKMQGTVQDITERKLIEIQMEQFSQVVQQIADTVVITDRNGVIEYVNPTFETVTGYSSSQAIGKTFRLLKSSQHNNEFYEKLWQTILHGEVFRHTLINKKKNGELFYEDKTISPLMDETGHVEGFVTTGKDVTKETHALLEMERLATQDKLTGIYNRHKFEQMFESETARADRFDEQFSVLLIDIDHFKKVNDTHGHDVGDTVLVELTQRIAGTIRKIDIFARWGGEEFFILLPKTSLIQAQETAEKLRLIIQESPFSEVGYLTISLGVAERQKDESLKKLFKRVDAALYSAKESGRNRIGTAA